MFVRVTEVNYFTIKCLVDSDLCLNTIIHGKRKNFNNGGLRVRILYISTCIIQFLREEEFLSDLKGYELIELDVHA